MALLNKKSPKRPFRGEISQKVTSMTPLNIGSAIGISECMGKIRIFLQNKVNSPTISRPSQYIPTVHKLRKFGALIF